MSGTKPDAQVKSIKDPDIVEACKATVEDLDPVQLDNTYNSKKAYVGHNLSEPDMPGIPRDIATHRLNVDSLYPLDTKGLWLELLPEVLWAYHTTPKTSTGETPYSLVYETDAVIPVEVRQPSLRYTNESGPSNDESRLQDLDEVEERRDMAHVRMVAQKQQVERYYNKKAKV
uniref:Uncharacterized protein LOC104242209 n=1 Tax=Nicotiana sylvestris TaxID=4096 RepID=A0A1U7Y8H1_NICSY|nr:PREDICTED: uncharacterized protein LOC104242209 [Nicotiana sylvestris]